MSGFIKIKSKALLLDNTLKLFFVTFVSFILKSGTTILTIFFTHFILVSDIFQSLLIEYNSLLVYFIYSLFVVIAFFLLFMFISGLKTGEKAIYFMQSKGSNAKFKYLFIFPSSVNNCFSVSVYIESSLSFGLLIAGLGIVFGMIYILLSFF